MANNKKGASSFTGGMNVSSISSPEVATTTLVYNKSIRQQILKKFLGEADEEAKEQFRRNLFILSRMLLNYLSASERILLCFDNSAIQCIINKDRSVNRLIQYI